MQMTRKGLTASLMGALLGTFGIGACSAGGTVGVPRPPGPTTIPITTVATTGTTGTSGTTGATTATSAPTSNPNPARNIDVTDDVRHALLAAFTTFNQLRPGDIAGPRAGSVYYAYLPSTASYWAVATFDGTPSAPQQTQINLQDGGNIGVFTRPQNGDWKMTTTGGEPFPCPGLVPSQVQAVWGLATPNGCPSGPP